MTHLLTQLSTITANESHQLALLIPQLDRIIEHRAKAIIAAKQEDRDVSLQEADLNTLFEVRETCLSIEKAYHALLTRLHEAFLLEIEGYKNYIEILELSTHSCDESFKLTADILLQQLEKGRK